MKTKNKMEAVSSKKECLICNDTPKSKRKCVKVTWDTLGSGVYCESCIRGLQSTLTVNSLLLKGLKQEFPKHVLGGNCDLLRPSDDDVCMEHEEPRGSCDQCPPCPECNPPPRLLIRKHPPKKSVKKSRAKR